MTASLKSFVSASGQFYATIVKYTEIMLYYVLFLYIDVGLLRSVFLGDDDLSPKDVIVMPSVHEQEDG